MSVISRLLDAVRSWRRGGDGGRRTAKRAGVSVEHLDHRQLLSVNFTGNVATDFPASTRPGVAALPDNSSVQHPVISDPALKALVKVSGFDINGLRVTYTAADDTLSVGIAQPPSQQAGHPGPVVAGDADNNGNDGTVDPAVVALEGTGFRDSPDFGASEFMGVFLDLKGQNFADVSAGYAINDPRSPKQYVVATAEAGNSPAAPSLDFGNGQVRQPGTVFTDAPEFEGNVYKLNSPAHPNLEFDITHFSELYLRETGKALTPASVIGLGAAAGSGDDPGIGEAFFPEQKFALGTATTLPPAVCPPASPPVLINPHQNRHINTAHETLIRASVLGSSGFDVSQIDPATVTLGGAHPVFSFDRFINKDNWADATFVFRGSDVHLPRGFTEATLAGRLTTGTSFSSSERVFNRDASYYSAAADRAASARQARRAEAGVVVAPNSPVAISGSAVALKTPAFAPGSPNRALVSSTLKVDYTTAATAATSGVVAESTHRHATHARVKVHSRPDAAVAPVVSVERQRPATAKLPHHVRKSLDRFARDANRTHAGTVAAKNVRRKPTNTGESAWDSALKAIGLDHTRTRKAAHKILRPPAHKAVAAHPAAHTVAPPGGAE